MLPRLLGKTNEAATRELLKRIMRIDRAEAGDPFAASRHHDVNALLDAVEVLAEAIMQCTDTNLTLVAL